MLWYQNGNDPWLVEKDLDWLRILKERFDRWRFLENIPVSFSLNVSVLEKSNWSLSKSNSSRKLYDSGGGVADVRRKFELTFGVWISPTLPNKFLISPLYNSKHFFSFIFQFNPTDILFSNFLNAFFELCLHLIYSPFILLTICCLDWCVNTV